MRCFKKLLGISYRDHITNDAVRDRIRRAIGPYDYILTTVKKRKLKWFGHVSRSSGFAKTILQGGRRRGRQKKRWENNIAEWTGLKFCDAVREAENKIKWRERVATSWRPNGRWLRDRCRCRCRPVSESPHDIVSRSVSLWISRPVSESPHVSQSIRPSVKPWWFTSQWVITSQSVS